jgi:hypothetical protein
MGKLITYVCDCPNCGAVKKKSNNWYIFRTNETSIEFFPLHNNEKALELPGRSVADTVGVVCSHSCAQKVLEAFLGQLDMNLAAEELKRLNENKEEKKVIGVELLSLLE